MSMKKPLPKSQHSFHTDSSWSKPSHPVMCVDQNVAPSPPQRPKRSWVRSKRISLGCLGWRSAESPKSQLALSYRGAEPRHYESHHHFTSTTDESTRDSKTSRPPPAESGDRLYKRGRPKTGSGADALLRRLRKRSVHKGGPTLNDSDPSPSCHPHTRSLSESQTGDFFSNVNTEWQLPTKSAFDSHSSASRSILSIKSAPEFTEDVSSSSPDFTSNGNGGRFPGMKLNNIIQPFTVGSSNMNQFCALADTAQPRNGPDQLLYPRQMLRYPYDLPKTTTSLFRPLSQPSFLQHGCHWNTSVEQSRWFDLPHPPFPETTGLQEAPGYPVLGLMTEATFTMSSTSPFGPLPFRPSYSAHESQVTHSSRNFPILLEKPRLLSNSDSTHKTHMNSPRAGFAASDKCWPHVSTSGLVGTCYPVHYTTGHPAAPEPAEMVYRYTTSPLQGRAIRDAHVQTDEPPTPPSHLLRLENSRCAVTIGTHGLPTRPDSLLSSSSLTADSSASESAPNSSSSRDSALGGGCSSTHRTFETSKLSNTLSGTVESPKLHAMHFHQNRGVGTELVTPGESRRPTPFRVMRPKVSLAHTPLDMSHPPTPKRTALPSLNIVGDPPSSPLRTSQRIRAERKNSSYVNAALYQLPTTQAGDRRILGSLSPPTAWAQLLPYRVSTVPQNLSERLKKSETLPNDVWVHMQHSCSGIEREHQTIDGLSSLCEASDWHKNACPRSPPPRPPMRTSSQKQATAIRPPLLSQQNHPVGNTSTRPSSDKTLPHATDPVVQTGDFVHAMFSSSHDQMEDSPVLCRYSQLYTLPFNPKSSAIPKNITERLPPPISSNVEPPVMQMGKLHLTS